MSKFQEKSFNIYCVIKGNLKKLYKFYDSQFNESLVVGYNHSQILFC